MIALAGLWAITETGRAMPIRKRTRRGRGGITGAKVYELLTGEIALAHVNYDGYDRDGARQGRLEEFNEFDRDAVRHDWEVYGKELTAFWKSGECTCRETLLPFGIDVKIGPHLWEHGGPNSVPWAAKLYAKTKPATKNIGRRR